MRATSRKIMDDEPEEIEALLPWYAAGTLSVHDAHRVAEALTHNLVLQKQYAVIQEEYAETVQLNESLGAPSTQTMQKLFAAIAAEPSRKPVALAKWPTGLGAFFSGLSPRTLAWSASLGALALVVQAGVIGALLAEVDTRSIVTASYQDQARPQVTRSLAPSASLHALVRFIPDARMADVTALLDRYAASVTGNSKEGALRLQFGAKALSDREAADLVAKFGKEKIVSAVTRIP